MLTCLVSLWHYISVIMWNLHINSYTHPTHHEGKSEWNQHLIQNSNPSLICLLSSPDTKQAEKQEHKVRKVQSMESNEACDAQKTVHLEMYDKFLLAQNGSQLNVGSEYCDGKNSINNTAVQCFYQHEHWHTHIYILWKNTGLTLSVGETTVQVQSFILIIFL